MQKPPSKPVTTQRLLRWFDLHQRDLPWRKNKTPYRIWVSEIMLQQTQVVTVIDYFNRFVKKFPTVKRLAGAEESDVLKLWEGLGYYRRARQMHAAAKLVVAQHNGKFPTGLADVLALPGIGRYTAGAILSISLDQPLPVLEGNTIRLFARLLAMKTDPRSTSNQKSLWKFAEEILPNKRVGDFNQALMELGNQVCTPKNPGCPQCPLMDRCPTFAGGLQAVIPAAGKKTTYENITEAVVLVQRRGKYLVRIYEPGQRWAGLWDFPRFRIDGYKGKRIREALQASLKQDYGLAVSLVPTTLRFQHAVTRFRISLVAYEAEIVTGRVKKSGPKFQWSSLPNIDSLPMSITGRKIAERLKKRN